MNAIFATLLLVISCFALTTRGMECYSCYAFGDIGDYHCHDEYVPAAGDTGVCETDNVNFVPVCHKSTITAEGVTTTSRGCFLGPDTDENEKCTVGDSGIIICNCKTDKCNSASSMATQFAVVLLTLLTVFSVSHLNL